MNKPYNRCWHEDADRQQDCWNEARAMCFHCKAMVCEQHARQANIDGYQRILCVRCFESPELVRRSNSGALLPNWSYPL